MNQESLDRANGFLSVVAARVRVGELIEASPAEIGREVGITEPLAAARAVRALLARKRLEAVDGGYRLLDSRPVAPGEREQIVRKPRSPRAAKSRSRSPRDARPTYSEVGREAVERLIELGREAATLRSSLKAAREEARDAREARDEAERRAENLSGRVRDLESRAEMAESNLRTLLATAKGIARADTPVGDSEMEAILGVLRREDEPAREGDGRIPVEAETPGVSEP